MGFMTSISDGVQSIIHGPGVPPLVLCPVGTWYLYFAGHHPSVPMSSPNLFDPKLPQPYIMPPNVSVPANSTVAGHHT
jgi:hypothetical protein